ncbi:M35 family metallopeptidase [Streptomyces racemochromogenes]|uniref:M35 family metallopeptidase n=1 Tax=Streptomyces racemochromogenes TaxID=67353 RepID=UPI0035E9B49E
MNSLIFHCELQARRQYRLGEPIEITFELRNVSDDIYRVLTWDIPIEGRALNFLSVSYEGSNLLYDGPLIKRGDPTQERYITLRPGESRSAEVDISKLYAIQAPGEYVLTVACALSDAYPVADDGSPSTRARASHEPRELERASVTITVEAGDPPRMTLGQQARMAELRELPSEEAREAYYPILQGGNTVERERTRDAHWHAVTKVNQAVQHLEASGPASGKYREWFGANVPLFPEITSGLTTFTVTLNNFKLIQSIMSFPTFLPQTYILQPVGELCNSETFAYTYSGTTKVWLCLLYWFAPLYGAPDTKYGTLVHEWSHAIASTEDYAVGVDSCRALAISKPKQAVYNADSYEYFVEYL